jgi:hypothetical protein
MIRGEHPEGFYDSQQGNVPVQTRLYESNPRQGRQQSAEEVCFDPPVAVIIIEHLLTLVQMGLRLVIAAEKSPCGPGIVSRPSNAA